MLYPLIALNSIREKEAYTPRRRLWDDAFKSRGMCTSPIQITLTPATVLKQRNDQDVIIRYAISLVEHIEGVKSESLNMNMWFGFLTFDVMGEFAFATSFNMLKTGKWDKGIKLVREGIDILGPISPVPWLAQIGFLIPGVAMSWKQMLAWCTRIMKERLAVRDQTLDLKISC
jgi:hypothetical protein